MVDPLGTLQTIYDLAKKIKELVGTFRDNQEDCSRLLELIASVSTIVKWLQKQLSQMTTTTTGIPDHHHPMSAALKGLEEALRRGHREIVGCQRKNGAMRVLGANDIAAKLRRVWEDVSRNLVVAQFAIAVYNLFSPPARARMIADVKDIVKAVRAKDDSSISSKLPRLSKQIQDALPAGFHLPPEVEKSVQTYCTSVHSAASSQNKDKGKPNKPKVGLTIGSGSNSASKKSTVARQGGRKSIIVNKASSCSSAKLEVVRQISKAHPLKLFCFTTWDPKKKTMQWAMTLTNNRRHSYFAVWIDPPRNEQFTCPRTTRVKPRSTLALSVTMKMHEQPPRDMGKFEVLMISVQCRQDVDKLQSASVHGKLTLDNGNKVLDNNRMQGQVYLERLTGMTCEPTRYQIIRRIHTKTGTTLRPIEVHPKKKWVVMTSDETGGCVIWDYQKEIKVMELQVKRKQRVCSAKFMVQKEWLAVGTGDASIYIYSYAGSDQLREVDSFKAYAGCSEEETKAYANKAINSLAVHPREPRLLLAFGSTIMQWCYVRDDNTWKRIRKIEGHNPVRSLKYNPRPRGGDDTFVSVTRDNEAKIYTTEFSSDPAITLKGTSSADYYPNESNRHWVVTCQNASTKSEIRDFKKREIVHTLELSGLEMVQVACHPTRQTLATSTIPKDQDKRNTKDRGTGCTTSEDGIIYLWDVNTYRLQEMVQIPGMGSRHSMEFATDDRNGLTRLFVKFETTIAIVEVNLPVANTSQQTGL